MPHHTNLRIGYDSTIYFIIVLLVGLRSSYQVARCLDMAYYVASSIDVAHSPALLPQNIFQL